MSIESEVKKQYSKFFDKTDSSVFKLMAEYYLRKATELKKADININPSIDLLIRNTQKRLFIGIGCELLIKAYFLSKGYWINRPTKKSDLSPDVPHLLNAVAKDKFKEDDSITLGNVLNLLPKTDVFQGIGKEVEKKIMKGFRIAKVFRNKEGHVATLWHNYVEENYTDIEVALMQFYKIAFSEKKEIQFSFAENEKSVFSDNE